jgi:hypothetical protein
MKQRLRSKLTYANVMATIAVFLVLGGGSAVALSGSNTVQSDDLGPGAQVKAADVADNAVNGADVQNGSLRQADLGVRVRGATQPESGTGSFCGQGAQYDACATVLFNNPRDQRILLVGSGEWQGTVLNGTNLGECAFFIGQLPLGNREFGEKSSSLTGQSNLAMNTVTDRPLDKGNYVVRIGCRDVSGGITVTDVELSVVGVGDG